MSYEEKKNGYMGKVLWIDLEHKAIRKENIPDEDYRRYLGGYGIGAKIIFENQKPGVDPLSGENILGFMSGLLTGTDAIFTCEFQVMGKSPLTHMWGDSNCNSDFAPEIKKTGYDGFFFTGKSEKPVYLLIDGGDIQLIDDSDLWGLDAYETTQTLKERHGESFMIAAIGQGGENQALISGIVLEGGILAGQNGLGALMGSKNLKAVCIKGTHDVKVQDEMAIRLESHKFTSKFQTFKHPAFDYIESELSTKSWATDILAYLYEKGRLDKILPAEINRYTLMKWGTSGFVSLSAMEGDSPIKNWSGSGKVDFPTEKSHKISSDALMKHQDRHYTCESCPIHCGAILKDETLLILTLEKESYDLKDAYKPEYDALCGFGSLLCSDNLEHIIIINDKLIKAGLSITSAAATIGWFYEIYQKDFIDKNHPSLEGLTPAWGENYTALLIVDQMINGTGIGQYLRNGIEVAFQAMLDESIILKVHEDDVKICGMTIHGQELPMHDPRIKSGLAIGVAYEAEPTPGRYVASLKGIYGFMDEERQSTYKMHPLTKYYGKDATGDELMMFSCFTDLINGLGLCPFAFDLDLNLPIVMWTNSATGWDMDFDELLNCGRRIKILRHSFNIREGIQPLDIQLPKRIRETPDDMTGINKDVHHDFDFAKEKYFKAMGYDEVTCKPLKETLKAYDMDFVMDALYPSSKEED